MYIPSHFLETDLDKIAQFIKTHPLGLMVANVDGDLVGNHLPFMALSGGIAVGSKLISHTAKANPIWKVGEKNKKYCWSFLDMKRISAHPPIPQRGRPIKLFPPITI